MSEKRITQEPERLDGAPHGQGHSLVAAAAAGAGTAGAAAFRGGQGHRGFHRKAHIREIDLHSLDLFQQGLVDAESEAVLFLGLILIIRLIQSQRETRAASAAGQIYPDGISFLIRKVRFQFFAGAFGQFEHNSSKVLIPQ